MSTGNILTTVAVTIMFWAFINGQDWHFTGENIALNKRAEQHPETLRGYVAGLANDGNTNNSIPAGNSCSHTNMIHHGVAYWKVFLDGYFIIKGIRIYNRDLYQYRLVNFQVIGDPSNETLYDDGSSPTPLYNNSIIDIPVTSTTQFTEIKLQVPAHEDFPDTGRSMMTLCEVEIYTAMRGCLFIAEYDLSWSVRKNSGFAHTTYGLVSVGSILDVQCIVPGFVVLESPHLTMTCLQNGSYSRTLPTCIEIVCPVPVVVENGKYTHTEKTIYQRGDYISLQCNDGYKPRLPQTRECLNSSAWSGNEPMCSVIMCVYPDTFTNGILILPNGREFHSVNVTSGTIVNVKCNEGFVSGSTTSQCTVDGVWDKSPTCTEIVKQESENLSVIAGSSAGAVTAVGLVVLIGIVIWKRRRQTNRKQNLNTEDHATNNLSQHIETYTRIYDISGDEHVYQTVYENVASDQDYYLTPL